MHIISIVPYYIRLGGNIFEICVFVNLQFISLRYNKLCGKYTAWQINHFYPKDGIII